jgi:hypothetical protein
MGEDYILNTNRERAMSEQYADAALGRTAASPEQAALESFAKSIQENDQSMLDMLTNVNKALVSLAQATNVQADELHQTLAQSARETADAFSKVMLDGTAVTSDSISEMQDGLTKVIQDVNKLGPEIELTAEVNDSVKAMRQEASQFASKMVATFEAVQQNTQEMTERIAEVAESKSTTPAEAAKAETGEGIYQHEGIGEIMVDALKYPVGILLDMFQTLGDIGSGMKKQYEAEKQAYEDLKEGLTNAYDASVGRIVTGVEDGMKSVFNTFFKDTAQALGFLVGSGVALNDEFVAGFEWFKENWQEVPIMIGTKIGEAWDKFKEVWSDTIAPAIGEFVMDAMYWLWEQAPAIKDWLGESLTTVVAEIAALPDKIYDAIWARKKAERESKAAVASTGRVVRETLKAGGVGAEALTAATAAGARPEQTYALVGLAESAEQFKEGGGDAVVEAFNQAVASGATLDEAREAATKAFHKIRGEATEASVPSIADREKKAQRRALLPQPTAGGQKEVVAALQGLGQKMEAGQRRAPRMLPPGLDTTGGPDDMGIVSYNTGGMSGGMRGGM